MTIFIGQWSKEVAYSALLILAGDSRGAAIWYIVFGRARYSLHIVTSGFDINRHVDRGDFCLRYPSIY